VSHPLMQWLDLGDVLLAQGTPVRSPPGGSVLIDSDAGAMLSLAPREGFEDAVLGFVLFESVTGEDGNLYERYPTNWPTRPSFASFALNVLGYLGGSRGGLESGSVRPGATVMLEGPDGQKTLDVRTPSGESLSAGAGPSGKFAFTGTGELGIYEVLAGGKTVGRFAVNLMDRSESDIPPGPTPVIKIGHVEVKGESPWQAARRELWKPLVAIGLAVLLMEWYIYNRRVYL
jgi:hypothetical protein